MLARLLVERWDALDVEGPVFSVDTAVSAVDIDGLAQSIRLVASTSGAAL
jgi:hypothetical protein